MALGIGGAQRRTFLIPFRLPFGLRGNGERKKGIFCCSRSFKDLNGGLDKLFFKKNEGVCGGGSSGS